MKRKKSFLFIILILLAQILLITSCKSNDDVGKKENEQMNFKEKIIYEDVINPERENLGNLAFSNEGEVILENNVLQDVYLLEDSKVIFNFGISYSGNFFNETDVDFKNWYLEKTTDNGEREYKIFFSEIAGATAEKFGGRNVDFDVGAWWPSQGGEVYPLENGDLMVVIYNPDLTCTVLEINPNTKKVINMAEYDIYGGRSYCIVILFVTQQYTVFSDPNTGDLLYYNNYTLNLDKQTKIPGCVENKVFGTSKFKLYNDYLYTVNDSGIYRNNQVDEEWENIINATETENLSKDEDMSCIDLLFESESVIYVLKIAPGEHEDIEEIVSIIKYEILQ